jgi:hypothetical protein
MQEDFFSELDLKAYDDKWMRINKIVLIVGLLAFNSLFVVYISYLFHTGVISKSVSQPKFIRMEIMCWALGLISSIILICAIAYTLVKLRAMFPGQEFSEKTRIGCIASIFCVTIFTKSIYEWFMFYLHTES